MLYHTVLKKNVFLFYSICITSQMFADNAAHFMNKYEEIANIGHLQMETQQFIHGPRQK